MMHDPRSAPRGALGLIFAILLLDVVGITILLPVAPYIVQRFSDDAFSLTLLTAIYAAAQFFAAPLMGKLGDRFGRRPVLLISLLGSAFGYLLFGLGGVLWLLLLSRLIDGITAGNQSVAAAYIADLSTPETQATNFSIIGMAWGIGLVIGPALGAVLGQISLTAPAFAAAAVAFASMLLGLILLPESLPREQREVKPLRFADLNPFATIGAMARLPDVGRLMLALCLFQLAFNGLNSTETLFLIDRFAAQPWQSGSLMVLAGLSIVVAQRVIQPFVTRYGEPAVALAGLAGQLVSALAMVVVPLLWLVFPIMLLKTLSSALIFPTLGTLMSGRVSSREQGVLMGVTTALGSLTSIVGPVWAGLAYDHLAPVAPYWIGAIIFASAVFLATTFPRQHIQHTTGYNSIMLLKEDHNTCKSALDVEQIF